MNAAFIFCPAAATHIAGHILFNLDVFGNAFGNFLVSESYFNAYVAASCPTGSLSAAASMTSSKKAGENILAKNVSKLTEDVVHIHASGMWPPALWSGARSGGGFKDPPSTGPLSYRPRSRGLNPLVERALARRKVVREASKRVEVTQRLAASGL